MANDNTFSVNRRDHRPSFGALYLEDIRSKEVLGLNAAQFRVWAVLVAHTGKNFASARLKQRTLANETGLAQSTVRKALYVLRDLGLIEIEERISDDHAQLCNDYTVLQPPSIRRPVLEPPRDDD